MKKIGFLTLVCILTMQTPVFAAYGSPNYTVILYEAQKNGFLDVETRPLTLVLGEQSCTVESFQAARTIFVPLRETAAFLGKTADYDKTNHTITLLEEVTAPLPSAQIKAGKKRVYPSTVPIFYGNRALYFKDGHPDLENAYSLDGRLYVPLKLLTEASFLWFTKEENTITLQSPSGLVVSVKTVTFPNPNGSLKEVLQFLDSLTPLSFDSKAALEPYFEEIRSREKYAFGDYLQIKSMEHAIVLYEDAPHILTCSHLLPLDDCVIFQHYTLYRLNL